MLSKLPNFVSKLYQLVNDPAYDHIIAWNDQGDALVIPDFRLLKNDGLEDYFPDVKYDSFRRQLNNYLFSRETSANTEERVFKHPFFKRGRPELLKRIKRAEESQAEARMKFRTLDHNDLQSETSRKSETLFDKLEETTIKYEKQLPNSRFQLKNKDKLVGNKRLMVYIPMSADDQSERSQ